MVGVSLSKVTVTTEEGVRLLRPSTREIKPRSDRAFGPPITAEAGRPSRSASNEARTVSAGKSVDSVVVIKAGGRDWTVRRDDDLDECPAENEKSKDSPVRGTKLVLIGSHERDKNSTK